MTAPKTSIPATRWRCPVCDRPFRVCAGQTVGEFEADHYAVSPCGRRQTALIRGRAPYGLSQDGHLVPNEAEQRVVDIICRLRTSGMTTRAIEAELARQKIHNRSGGPFLATKIVRVLGRAEVKA